MSYAAGKLRQWVALQQFTSAQDPETGEITETWTTTDEVWANIEPLSVRDFIQSGATQTELSARITIRYRPDINSTWRILHRGKIYNPEGVMPDKESGIEYLTLPVSEGVNEGE